MKTALIIMGVTVAAALQFVVYCCLRMASMEDAAMEKLEAGKGGSKEKEE